MLPSGTVLALLSGKMVLVRRQCQEQQMGLAVHFGQDTAKCGSSVAMPSYGRETFAVHTSLLVLGCHTSQRGKQLRIRGRVDNLFDDTVCLTCSEKNRT